MGKKQKKPKKIHRDNRGREFIKETFFIGGKMKVRKIYVIDGIPADEYYLQNATDMDFYMNGDYELMSCNKSSDDLIIDENLIESYNDEPDMYEQGIDECEMAKLDLIKPFTEDLDDLPF